MTFRIHDTEITVRFGFLAVLALMLCFDGGQHVLPAVLACAVHEGGHLLAARLCGMRVESVCFGALGIRMSGETASVSHLRRAAVSLAGPLMNLLFFVLLLPAPPAFCTVQLLLFLFHILPAVPLDGGMGLYSLLCSVCPEKS
ncbi:MAG: M50 family metallopeptidase, partial [Hominenteromicrobium sp.]